MVVKTLNNPLQPLTHNVPIVNKDGSPTPEFMRKWAQQQAANSTIVDLTTSEGVSAVLDIIGGTPGAVLYRGELGWAMLLPGDDGRVLTTHGPDEAPTWEDSTADIQALLDTISNVQGTVLFRGASAWVGLAPGDDGQVLTAGGMAADVHWAASGGRGFGFFAEGLLTDNEFLGEALFPTDMTFTSGDMATIVKSIVPAAADAALSLVTTDSGGFDVTVGTITFAAGSKVGVLVWAPSPYTLAAGSILRMYGPTPPDATLAYVTGTVNGTPA